jgi:alanyl-tRNA synthetase
MFGSGEIEFTVTDTLKKLGDLHVHVGKVGGKGIEVGDAVEMSVDVVRRSKLRANHSATHLLHAALRKILGAHVTQKGSLVAPDRLRFDFSHPKPIAHDELKRIEAEVNRQIRQNGEVTTRLMASDAAIAAGAMALFGEIYDDEVRVLTMGRYEGQPFSIELCGGTHVARTGDIAVFKIVSEAAVAAGVRRIEALTGEGAFNYLAGQEDLVRQAAGALKTVAGELPTRIESLVEERRKLEREISDLRRKLAAGGGASSAPSSRDAGGIKYAARKVEGVPARELKGLADDLKRQVGSGVVAVAAVEEGRASLVVGVTDDLKQRFNAVDLVRVGSEALGGKGGGGRPDMAQAGGPDGDKADAALDAIGEAVKRMATAA